MFLWLAGLSHGSGTRQNRGNVLDQLVVNSEYRQLEAVRYACLVEDVRDMMLYRFLADRKQFCDLLVFMTINDGFNDRQFTLSETELSVRKLCRHVLQQSVESTLKIGYRGTVHPILTGHNSIDAAEERLRCGVFENHTPCARPQRLFDFVDVQ